MNKAKIMCMIDVYVAGCERNDQGIYIAKLWKNGKAKNLTNGDRGDAKSFSVFVKKR